jgi:hypothetical protein
MLALLREVADMVTWALMGVLLPLLGAYMAALTIGFDVWLSP